MTQLQGSATESTNKMTGSTPDGRTEPHQGIEHQRSSGAAQSSGSVREDAHHDPHHAVPGFWLWIMCLTGVDYFSTLGYQPSIAFENAGLLAPLATIVLVLMTLFGALPVYRVVASQSFNGQGSILMIERLLEGWFGKLVVLLLLGFAATDFVITKTLSAADAAEHLIHNHYFHDYMPAWTHSQVAVTSLLLIFLGAMFLKGFTEVIALAVVLVAVYMSLNAAIIIPCVWHLISHPAVINEWLGNLSVGNWHIEHPPVQGKGLLAMMAAALLLFPKLALGMSGFETGVSVMPLVRGDKSDTPRHPLGRIRNTRKLLTLAALIMSVYLLTSSFAVSLLIPPQELLGGKASNRALAYLAHGEGGLKLAPYFGSIFGTIYDAATIGILWFAGASAMSGLLNLVPRYLPRYGMAPGWAASLRPLAIFFTGVNLLVTLIFRASVHDQGAAYATGVMVLMCSACVAVVIHHWPKKAVEAGASPEAGAVHTERPLANLPPPSTGIMHWPWYFLAVSAVFAYTTFTVIISKPVGLLIALCFVSVILISSVASRIVRSKELRFVKLEFVDETSRFLWDTVKYLSFPVLVPHRPGHRTLEVKERIIRKLHRLDEQTPIVFLEAELGDPSEFFHSPLIQVLQEESRFVIRITKCVSVAHAIAAIALELGKGGSPPELHFGWSDEATWRAYLGFLFLGEGNIPWHVRDLIRNAEPDSRKRPRVVIG